MSRVKIAEKNSSFLFSFQNFFSNFERKFFRLLAKKLQQFFKNYLLRVQRNNLWLEFFFVKFWTVSDFLQKLLAWFSKFYLRVQSKNCGKKVFFCFLSRILSTFEQKFFRLLAKKLQKVFKTTFCPSRGTFCDFNFFVKVLNLFGFSAETLVWFSKVYLSVQSKNCGKKSFFFCFFSRIFSTFEQKFFRLLAKKLQQFFKNYLLRVQRNNLWQKFWTVSDF